MTAHYAQKISVVYAVYSFTCVTLRFRLIEGDPVGRSRGLKGGKGWLKITTDDTIDDHVLQKSRGGGVN